MKKGVDARPMHEQEKIFIDIVIKTIYHEILEILEILESIFSKIKGKR